MIKSFLKLAALFVLFFAEGLFAAEALSCQFYKDVELSIPCGPRGYIKGYAEKYCHKFLNLGAKQEEAVLSFEGYQWRNKTLSCLQRAMNNYLINQSDLSCEKIKYYGFSSHAYCYLEEPASICQLPVSDWQIIIKTIQTQDIMNFIGLSQVYKVIAGCSRSF